MAYPSPTEDLTAVTNTDRPLRFPGAVAQRAPERSAIVLHETGESMTYRELHDHAARTAHVLRDLGVEPGDHVAVSMENRIEYPAVQWGAHYAGTYYTFLSTRLTPPEVAHILRDCAAEVVVVSAATAPSFLEAVALLDHAPAVLSVDAGIEGTRSLTELTAGAAPDVPDGATEGADMLYSSGTTGFPKGIRPTLTGAPLGTSSLVGDLGAMAFGLSEESVYLSPAPYYHAAPCKWVHGVTAIGGTAVLMERFDAEEALKAIAKHRVTHSQWVPTMFLRQLRLADDVKTRYDLSSHRVAIHAAAPCPVEVKQAMMDWWGPIIHEYYSGTEAIGMTHAAPQAWLDRPGTVGKPIFGDLRIRDEAGDEVPVGTDGLVTFTAGQTFEYHNDPQKTADARVGGDAVTMGDIGHVDEDGYLFLTDRQSNMIITGGVNVYPQEAENLLAGHPAVHDVAVIGIPDPDFGERVIAVVHPADDAAAGAALEEDLIAFCREHLADLKCPRRVDFRDDLPREPNGKLLKRRLRDEYRSRAATN